MKDQLTNEALKKQFHDNFALTQFAIRAARYLIKSGREVDVAELLEEIQEDPSLYTVEHLSKVERAENVAGPANE